MVVDCIFWAQAKPLRLVADTICRNALLLLDHRQVLVGSVVDVDDGAAFVDDQQAVGPDSKTPVLERVDDGPDGGEHGFLISKQCQEQTPKVASCNESLAVTLMTDFTRHLDASTNTRQLRVVLKPQKYTRFKIDDKFFTMSRMVWALERDKMKLGLNQEVH